MPIRIIVLTTMWVLTLVSALPGCGHNSHEDKPDFILELLPSGDVRIGDSTIGLQVLRATFQREAKRGLRTVYMVGGCSWQHKEVRLVYNALTVSGYGDIRIVIRRGEKLTSAVPVRFMNPYDEPRVDRLPREAFAAEISIKKNSIYLSNGPIQASSLQNHIEQLIRQHTTNSAVTVNIDGNSEHRVLLNVLDLCRSGGIRDVYIMESADQGLQLNLDVQKGSSLDKIQTE